MADNQALLENVQRGVAEQGANSVQQQVRDFKPVWSQYGLNQATQDLLALLEIDAPAMKSKLIMQGNPAVVQACIDVTGCQDPKAVQWILTLLYDMLREDSSCFAIFEELLKKKAPIAKPLMALLSSKKDDAYVCDKAAWLLSAIICHMPGFFSEEDVTGLIDATTACSEVGVLETFANLLKADQFRATVWNKAPVSERVFAVSAASSSPVLYRSVFAMWLLTFDAALVADLKGRKIVDKVKEIIATSRVEKVVRITLTVLRNLLKHKNICEEIVESHVLESVQSLEYEKWRDAELYDEIRDMIALVSHEVTEFSNFDRYERELATGKLSWGFVHTSKFWAENVMKFQESDFAALRKLALCLSSQDSTTLAVACHDLGEFVALHPLGKRKIAELNIKDRVMELMGSAGDDMREVRREALLCCQKIMLNKWHEMEKAGK